MKYPTPILVLLLLAESCLSERIVGGVNVTSPEEFPHQLSFRITDFGLGHVCGAVLIAWNKGLTAAHCINTGAYNYTYSVMGGAVRHSCEECAQRTVTSFIRV